MTSQRDQIQALIAEIDSVLQARNLRLPWRSGSGDVAQQHQALERVRNYLVALQEQPGLGAVSSTLANPGAYSATPQPSQLDVPGGGQSDPNAQQMMQTILHEMSYLRANLMQPLQADLDSLRQRRELLMQEVRQLEAQRQEAILAQVPADQPPTGDLLQVLMTRLQETLSQQIVQTLTTLRNQPVSTGNPLLSGTLPPVALSNSPSSSQQYEQLQVLRSRSDQMLVNLDSTLNIVFESLQRNIQSYQDSLSQGLERVHSLGQQSEITFKALVEQLAQQLRQEASSYLLNSLQTTAHPAGGAGNTSAAAIAEVPAAPETAQSPPAQPTPPPATALTQAPSALPNPVPSQPPSAASSSGASSSGLDVFPYAGAELLSTEFSGADFTTPLAIATDSVPEVNPLDHAVESWLRSVRDRLPDAESSDLNLTGVAALDLSDLELNRIELEPAPDDLTTDSDTIDIDAALKLLEDLGAQIDDSSADLSLESVDAQLNEVLDSLQPPPDEAVADSELSGDAQDELDDFYRLFEKPNEQPTAPPVTGEPTGRMEIAEDAEPINSVESDEDLMPDLVDTLAEPERTAAELLGEFAPRAPEAIDQSGSSPDNSATLEGSFALAELDSPAEGKISSLADLFSGVSSEAARSIPTDPPAIATSESLAAFQLFADADIATPLIDSPASAEFSFDSFGSSLQDQFTRAASDEILLPDAHTDEIAPDLNFDDLTLSSLSEDLSKLESIGDTGAIFDIASNTTFDISPEPTTLGGFAEPPLTDWQDASLGDFGDSFGANSQDFSSAHNDNATISPPSLVSNPVLEGELTTAPAIADFSEANSPAIDSLTTDSLATDFLAIDSLESDSPAIANETLTVEDFGASFGGTPIEPAPIDHTPVQSPSPTVAWDEAAPFTLDGMDDLFGDAMPIPTPPTPPILQSPPSLPNPTPFTLEGMNDLFGDPVTVPTIPIAESVPADQPLPFTLEGMDNLFADVPAVQSPLRSPTASPLASPPDPQVSPAPELSPPAPHPKEIPPFSVDHYVHNPLGEELPSFKLERLDSLFTETFETAVPVQNSQVLDQAFESLLGSPNLPTAPPPASSAEPSQPEPPPAEKKKRL